MYEETGCFDPNSMVEGSDDGLCQVLQTPPPQQQPLMAGSTTNSHNSYEDGLKLSADQELSYHPTNNFNNPHHHHPEDDASAAMEIQLQNQQLGLINTHLIQDSSNQVMTFNSSSSLQDSTFVQTPDLLNLFHLPGYSASASLPNSSITFSNPNHSTPLGFVGDLPMADTASASSILYDPLFHLNLPPQPPSFRDLFQSLPPHGFSLPGSRGGSLFGGRGCDQDHVEGNGGGDGVGVGGGGIYQDGDGEHQFDNGVLDFTFDMACMGKERHDGKMTKHFATERQRRQHINDKYQTLKSLVPNPTKTDRASIVQEAIVYIKELLRTVNELKILVEKKRYGRGGGRKRQKTDEDSTVVNNSNNNNNNNNNGNETSSVGKPVGGDPDQAFNNGSLRSSWLQRKSKETEVDVRIIDDEVTIKLVQRKKINCLLFVSKVLDELELDLHHVAGGHVGDYYSFLFNTKIYEGSSVYASAIANKLIEVVDRHYASTSSSSVAMSRI